LSIVNDNVVWVSGTGGTFVRTTDGGETWHAGTVAGAEKFDFRGVYAIDGEAAYLLSIGKRNESRIYKTTDAGKNWLLEYTEQNPNAALDCMAFWDWTHGIVVGDPLDGKPELLTPPTAGTGRRFRRTRYLRQRTVKARRRLERASQRMLRRKGERTTCRRGS
jgi:photosystem II stability/assembly factor-like uncharacterized protein